MSSKHQMQQKKRSCSSFGQELLEELFGARPGHVQKPYDDAVQLTARSILLSIGDVAHAESHIAASSFSMGAGELSFTARVRGPNITASQARWWFGLGSQLKRAMSSYVFHSSTETCYACIGRNSG